MLSAPATGDLLDPADWTLGDALARDPPGFPGISPPGAKKFTIRKDPAAPGYWSLASIIAAENSQQGKSWCPRLVIKNFAKIRFVIVLIKS